jgi:hypothetical protein
VFCPTNKIAFVHNQKTGGTSMERWLKRRCPDAIQVGFPHTLAREMHEQLGHEQWEDYFSFGFVRNPWDRLVSWWGMIRDRPAVFAAYPFWRYALPRSSTFEEFVLGCTDAVPSINSTESAARPQLDYFTDAHGAVLVDFIGRFETLQEDLAIVAERCGLPPGPAAILNVAVVKRNYREFYTPELRDIVAERFAVDIERFRYTY